MDEAPGVITTLLPLLWVPDRQDLTGRLRLVYDFPDRPSDDAIDSGYQILRCFADLGTNGAFPANGVLAHLSKVTLAEAPRLSDTQLSSVFDATDIDTRALQCLRNMSARAYRGNRIQLTRITAQLMDGSVRNTELAAPDELNQDTVYPPVSDRIRFPVDWVNTEYSRARSCYVECGLPLRPADILDLRARSAPWYQAVEQGAFAPPVGLPEELECVRGSVEQFEEASLEISISVFEGTENVWNPLINIIDGWSQARVPVVRIVVE